MVEQVLMPSPLVITNCTSRKRAAGSPVRLTTPARLASLAELAARWKRLVTTAPAQTAAGDLYVGRAMTEAKFVCREIGAELCIVSAGLGLVHERHMVPNYDVSASARHSVLVGALRESGNEMSEWWIELTRKISGRGINEVVRADCRRLVFVALPASYLRLVSRDLAAIEPKFAENLRILTSEAGAMEVPAHLRDCVLPYTEQLESIDGFGGTRAEFPQRALRHFAVALSGSSLSLPHAHAAVRECLSRFKHRHVPKRQRKTDEEIADLIRQGWADCVGSSTKLHRYIRDERIVACEQSRFREIWHQVRAEFVSGRN